MKITKLIIGLLVIFAFSLSVDAQDYSLGVKNVKVTQIISADTLASAGADTVDIKLYTIGNKTVNFSLQTISANVSGTSEGYTDLYKSNDNVNWELVATRTAADTLNSSNLVNFRTDVDGYDARYLRLIITNKTQTQSTIYNSYLYIWEDN